MNNTNFNFYQDGALWIFSKNFDYTHAYVVGSKILYFVWDKHNKYKGDCVLKGWDSTDSGSDYLDYINRVCLVNHVPVNLSGILEKEPVWKQGDSIVEMTLEEVAESLGIPVWQLRIKD